MLRDDTPSRRDQAGLWKINPLRATRYVKTTPDSVLEQHEVGGQKMLPLSHILPQAPAFSHCHNQDMGLDIQADQVINHLV